MSASNNSILLAFAGDIALNDDFMHLSEDRLDGVFRDVRRLLDEGGVTAFFANLESPLEGESENSLKYPRLKTNERAMRALKTLAPHTLVLGNNHVFDCLSQGLDRTRSWLEKNGIGHTGAFHDTQEARKPYRFLLKGRGFSLLSYVATDTHPSLPEGAPVVLNEAEETRMIEDVGRESKSSTVIVSLHWGVEFSHYPSPTQRFVARKLIDAGATIVMGHHTHTLQGFERWNRGVIFYSLGNFAFSDVRECRPPVLWTKDQRHGGLALVRLDGVTPTEVAVQVTAMQGTRVIPQNDRHWDGKIKKRSLPLMLSEDAYRRFWNRYQFLESVVKPPFRYFFGERKSIFKQISTVRPRHIKKIYDYVSTFLTRSQRS